MTIIGKIFLIISSGFVGVIGLGISYCGVMMSIENSSQKHGSYSGFLVISVPSVIIGFVVVYGAYRLFKDESTRNKPDNENAIKEKKVLQHKRDAKW